MSPRQVLREHSSRELSQWWELDKREPLNQSFRIELQLAQIAALLFNINRKKGTSAKTAWDFLIFGSRPEDETMGVSQQQSFVLQIANSMRKKHGDSRNAERRHHRD